MHATMKAPVGLVQQGSIHSNIPDTACLNTDLAYACLLAAYSVALVTITSVF